MNREWYLLEMGVSLNTYKTLEEAQAIKEFLPNATIIHVQEVIKDKEPTQATSELDELREWVEQTFKNRPQFGSSNDYFMALHDVLAKIDSLKSGE